MIIFYNKKTGTIIGTIDGRVHSKDQIDKMWVGDKKETERIICNWKRISKTNYEPDHKQKEIFIELDKQPVSIYGYKVNLKTKELAKIVKK